MKNQLWVLALALALAALLTWATTPLRPKHESLPRWPLRLLNGGNT